MLEALPDGDESVESDVVGADLAQGVTDAQGLFAEFLAQCDQARADAAVEVAAAARVASRPSATPSIDVCRISAKVVWLPRGVTRGGVIEIEGDGPGSGSALAADAARKGLRWQWITAGPTSSGSSALFCCRPHAGLSQVPRHLESHPHDEPRRH